jgi:hypothetical protein
MDSESNYLEVTARRTFRDSGREAQSNDCMAALLPPPIPLLPFLLAAGALGIYRFLFSTASRVPHDTP